MRTLPLQTHHNHRDHRTHYGAGFTMIEMVIAIVIASVLVVMVSLFIRTPVLSYVDSVRRAELTDVADYTLRRMSRELRQALPNSVRIQTVGGITYIEFIATTGGGRYCNLMDGIACGTPLDFTPGNANLSFDVVGSTAAAVPIVAGDFIVVYNQGWNSARNSSEPLDAYACGRANGCNRAVVAGIAGNTVTLASNVFGAQTPSTSGSPSSRFHVVPQNVQAITYACPSVRGQMVRYANYGISWVQPTPNAGGSVMTNNASCAVSYDSGFGMLIIGLTIFDDTGTESVTLLHEIHLDNSP